MKNPDYWEMRAILKEQRMKKLSDEYLKELRIIYEQTEKALWQDILKFRQRFYTETDGTLIELNQPLSEEETRAFYEAVEEQLRQGLNLDEKILEQIKKYYFKERLTRLEGLRAQVKSYIHALTEYQTVGTSEHLKNIYKESYYQTTHELYNDITGFSLLEDLQAPSSFIQASFQILDDKAVGIAVSKPWSGKSFSKRIWKNNDKLAKELQQVLGIGLGQGHSIERMARDLDFRMKQGYKNAQRIVRTETNFVMSEANAEAYKTSGVERYQFVAVLDYKTSEICQSLDGKIFPMEERKVGLNCNPMHPNCRSTTAPYTGRKIPTRIARGTDGKTYFVDGDLNYKQWYENLAQEEKDKIQLLRTMDKNKSADLKQFEKYKEILGKDIPKTFEKFQAYKYTKAELFGRIKLDYRRRNYLLQNPESKLPNVDTATIAEEKFTKYLFGGNIEKGLKKGKNITKKLGYDISNHKEFEKEILKRAKINPSKPKGENNFGTRYEQKIMMYNQDNEPINLIVAWQVNGESTHMTTVYIKEV